MMIFDNHPFILRAGNFLVVLIRNRGAFLRDEGAYVCTMSTT